MSVGLVAPSNQANLQTRTYGYSEQSESPSTGSSDVCTFSPEATRAMSPPAHTEEHHSGGGGILGDIGGFFSGAANTVEHTVSNGVNGAENWLSGAGHTVSNGLGQAGSFLAGVGKSIYLAPFQLLAGKHDIPAPGLPPYPTLNPAEKAAAMRPGQTVSQPITEDPGGGHHEPITLMYNGPLNKLTNALESQGWSKPGLIPISPMTVNGHPQILALQKNAQLGGLSRDHLRIFQMGTNRYGISATRDLQPFVRVHPSGSLSFGHETDPNIDGERDLVMNDILHADPSVAQNWQVVQGIPQEAESKNYHSDGQVYEFSM